MIEPLPWVGIPVGKLHVTAIGDGVGNSPVVTSNQNVASLDATKAARFFRLKRQ